MPINNTDFNYICRLVHEHTGIVLTKDKEYFVESRLVSVLKKSQLNSITELMPLLRQNSLTVLHDVIEVMVTTETSFFRDDYPFQAMSTVLLPELLQKRQEPRSLNIWSAACSSGQEPYSIAMVLRENFSQLVSWTVNLLATDICESMLERSCKGCYTSHEISRGLSKKRLDKYFVAQGKSWQIQPELRHMVKFQKLNLIDPWLLMPQMDIIFLRNVLIYFDVEMKKKILTKVKHLLNPEGYLFLGAGETTINLDPAFKPIQIGKSVCYQLKNK